MARFDPAAATAAYLAQLPPAAQAKAVAYTHGKEWLLLWGWLVAVFAAWLILRSGVLARIRDRIEARRPRLALTSFVVAVAFLLLDWLLTLPWSLYADWWREKSYGLTSQALAGWLTESVIGAGISAVLTAVFFLVLYAVIRKSPRFWWAWAGGVAALFMIFLFLIQPILIEPIFNKYTPAPPGPVRDTVVQLAKASGVPSDKIYIYNGSKQSNRYTANVAGLFGSARVAMSDVMFKKGADLAEVRGVVGHEMGHYARGHVLWFVLAFSLVAVFVFWLVQVLFPVVAHWMAASNVGGLSDPAGLPVVVAILATLGLLGTPVINSITRATEADADTFSLEHAHEPDGLAKALVKTIEYRAASPSRLEEILFYDHPSVSRRIRKAMDWKAAHMNQLASGPQQEQRPSKD